jgi:hypothetical protein
VFATDVDVWLFTAACNRPRFGIDTMFAHQYVTRFNAVAASRNPSSSGVMSVISVQTSE